MAVYIHGGGWSGGSSHLGAFYAQIESALVNRGITVASINYTLSGIAPWPAAIEDSTCAIRFLRAHAAEYQIDPARIAVYGDSAGGHLASMVGLTTPSDGFDGGQWSDQSSGVSAVVDLFGPADLTAKDWTTAAQRPVLAEFGAPLGSASPALMRASPVTHVSAGAPPFLIMHGVADNVVPVSQSQALAARLRSVNVPVTLVLVTNAGHEFARTGGLISPTSPQIVAQIVAFLTAKLGASAS